MVLWPKFHFSHNLIYKQHTSESPEGLDKITHSWALTLAKQIKILAEGGRIGICRYLVGLTYAKLKND